MTVFTADIDDVHTADERSQLEAFLDTHRRLLNESLDGITDEQARRRLVPSDTTMLGLVKHATYAEQVWFNEAITSTPRAELGLPPTAAESFLLATDDTVDSVRATHRRVCAASAQAAAALTMDDIVTGHRLGPLSLRWIYLHSIREFAQHAGHADILREQLLQQRH